MHAAVDLDVHLRRQQLPELGDPGERLEEKLLTRVARVDAHAQDEVDVRGERRLDGRFHRSLRHQCESDAQPMPARQRGRPNGIVGRLDVEGDAVPAGPRDLRDVTLRVRDHQVTVEHAATVRALLDAYAVAVPDDTLFARNVRFVSDHLVEHHGFALSSGDLTEIAHVQRAFFEAGPELRYAYPHRWFPSFADLMLETDDRGGLHGYLSTDEAFRRLKRLETANLVVPVIGDFAGRKAIRAVGRYLRAHAATVSVFYTSNVEFYLFESAGWKTFFENVASLPLDDQSVFVRAHFDAGPRAPSEPAGARSATQLDSMKAAIGAYDEGRIHSYSDVIGRSLQSTSRSNAEVQPSLDGNQASYGLAGAKDAK